MRCAPTSFLAFAFLRQTVRLACLAGASPSVADPAAAGFGAALDGADAGAGTLVWVAPAVAAAAISQPLTTEASAMQASIAGGNVRMVYPWNMIAKQAAVQE